MATAPATPVTLTAEAKTWLQKHERIVIVFLVLLAGAWGFSRYADLAAARTEARATAAEQALTSQKAVDAQNASQTAQVLAQYQAMVQAQSTQIASLAAAAAQRQTVLKQNQATDATLGLPALAGRLQTLGNVPDGQVSTEGNSVKITQSGTVAVVQTLETLPALQADLRDQITLTGAAQAAQKQGEVVIADQTKQIAGLNLTLVDADKQCKAQIAGVKAQGRKNSIKWFRRGFILGFVGGLFAGHAGM